MKVLEQRISQLSSMCHATEQKRSETAVALKVAEKKLIRHNLTTDFLKQQLELAKSECDNLKSQIAGNGTADTIGGSIGRQNPSSLRGGGGTGRRKSTNKTSPRNKSNTSNKETATELSLIT